MSFFQTVTEADWARVAVFCVAVFIIFIVARYLLKIYGEKGEGDNL